MSGKCLEVSTADLTTVEVSTCTGADNQQWRVNGESIKSAMTYPTIKSAMTYPTKTEEGGDMFVHFNAATPYRTAETEAVAVVATAGMCVDNGMKNPPSGTTGQCAELGNNNGILGPEIVLVNSESNGSPCEENNLPSAGETFTLEEGMLKVGGAAPGGDFNPNPNPTGGAAPGGDVNPSRTVRVFDRNLHSRMPLVPTPARFKRTGV
jgi:hypothetical protein